VRLRAGKYELFDAIGEGGMARVFLGRLLGPDGFARTVAVKRPLIDGNQKATFRRFVCREARLAARLHHPNVVSTLDVVDHGGELLIVMDYVHGLALSTLMQVQMSLGGRVPLDVGMALAVDALCGLQAAHEACDERGKPLGLIHRDVSPQNILCGADGSARLSDFGLSKARDLSCSDLAEFKGKLTYASPEQLQLVPATRQSDLFSMGIILWELVSGERAYAEHSPAQIVARLVSGEVPSLSDDVRDLPSGLRTVIERALQLDPSRRFGSALEMAEAIEVSVGLANAREVARWIGSVGSDLLEERERLVLAAERSTTESRRGGELAAPSGAPLDGPATEAGAPPLGPSGGRWLPPGVALRVGAVAVGVVLAALVVLLLPDVLYPASGPRPVQTDEASAGRRSVGPVVHGALQPAAPGQPNSAPRPVEQAPEEASAPQVERRALQARPGPMQRRSRVEPDVARASERRLQPAAPAPAPTHTGAERSDEHCFPPFSLDAEGIRHMKPGCR
jgi:serine/threonine-protein kinase